MAQTAEEELIDRYFDAFNRHDIDGVMACFHDDITLVGDGGVRTQGTEAVRDFYEHEFKTFPDGRCELRLKTGQNGRGVAESLFLGTSRDGRAIRALGAEVIEFKDGQISEIRDYHKLTDQP